MKLIPGQLNIILWLSTHEAELFIAGLRALHEKLVLEKCLTPQLQDEFISSIMILELGIMEQKQHPDFSQFIYDSIPKKA